MKNKNLADIEYLSAAAAAAVAVAAIGTIGFADALTLGPATFAGIARLPLMGSLYLAEGHRQDAIDALNATDTV